MEIIADVSYIFIENNNNGFVFHKQIKSDSNIKLMKGDAIGTIIVWEIKHNQMVKLKYHSNLLNIVKYTKRLSFALCFRTDNLIIIKTYNRKIKINIYYSCRPYHTLILPIIQNNKQRNIYNKIIL